MRYVLKEKVLLEVLKEAVEQLRYTVADIDNVSKNCLMRETKLAISIANRTGDATIQEEVIPIGRYAETVSGFWGTVNVGTATRLVEELQLAVDELEFPLNY